MYNHTVINGQREETSVNKFTGKVFLYMFIALMITALVAGLVGFIFKRAFPLDETGSVIVDGAIDQSLAKPYFTLLIVSFVVYIPLIIWIQVQTFRGKGSIIVPFIIYAIVMGVIMSAMTMFVDWSVISLSFAVTSVLFLGMFLIGFFSKKDLSFLAFIAFGILIGVVFISLFNIIWMLFFPGFTVMNWFVSYGLLAFVILITIFDFNRVRRIAENQPENNNLALICAFNLYVDFIYLFIRVLALVSRFMKK